MWDAPVEYRKVLVAQGGNADVRRVIWNVFSQYWQSVRPLVYDLRGLDVEDICYALFCYVLDNVQYKEDPGNNQFVKTPARLIRDGVGDCKSMCILQEHVHIHLQLFEVFGYSVQNAVCEF